MIENRRHARIREYLSVHWNVEDKGRKTAEGHGTALNISLSGMQVVTDKTFVPFDKCIFTIEAPLGESLPFGPKKAKLVWFKRIKKDGTDCFLCGLTYIKDPAFDHQLKKWIDEKLEEFSKATDAKILTNYLF